jgi:GNAT superfamily N-acetyltransferase
MTAVYHINFHPMGYAKFGYKDLYFYKKDGKVVESKRTPALLDFYVADQLQRKGIGIMLFHRILKVPEVSI